MAWRSAVRRTRQRPRNTMINRNTLVNSQSWSENKNSEESSVDQFGMHVRVLRYHEIRLGNIEKQLSTISRQLHNLGKPESQKESIKNSSLSTPNNTLDDGAVGQLEDVLRNLAEEVSSSNKMIKQFITGDKVAYKPIELKKTKQKPVIEKNEKDTIEWKLAKSRLMRCGIRATDERIRDMVKTMHEEVSLVNDIVDFKNEENIKDNLEVSVNEAVEETINEKKKIKKEQLETIKTIESDDEEEEETIDISTSKDIGFVPVHVVIRKKKPRKPKKKNNAK
jgi:hypothetical protein